jgi:ATP-dependent exoDNAse (exonuclease V) beta subunit
MSKLIVYKASAGSGKTYRLAAEYIKQLLTNPESYKSILAVTFTNKATAEMKGRILSELFKISKGEKSDIGSEIAQELNLNTDDLKDRAQKALSLILHDYTRFSISTIDSFVQRVIQALLWEIGEQGGVDIELDNVPVLEHAADNLLDSAATIDELLKWLTTMGYAQLDEGKSWDVRHKLVELGKQLFSEKFRLMSREEVQMFTDKERVNLLKDQLQKLVTSTTSEISEMAKFPLNELDKHGLSPELFLQKNRGVMGFFTKCAEVNNNYLELPLANNKYVLDALNDTTGEDWVSKSTLKDSALFAPIENVVRQTLHPQLTALARIVEEKNPQYISAKLILKNLENLALIGDLWNKVRELSREEGFLLLSDSGHLLKEFVKESDAPFVYEKVGTRYDMYMIDEFQDTSEVQWHNFRPLIENSLSQDFFSMIVGDVKQSIYRWRNSDWSILASGVAKDFAHYGTNEIALKTNWRSLKSIINFNNSFFEHAKNIAAQQIGGNPNDNQNNPATALLKDQIITAYSDVEQNVSEKSGGKSGYVEVNFFEYKKQNDRDEILSQHIPSLISELQSRYKLSDIAILVRTKNDGQRIANMLLEHNRTEPNSTNHIAFVSQEGLQLKTSLVVRLTIAALRLVQDSTNEIAKRILAKELATLSNQSNPIWHNHFTTDLTEAEAAWLSALNTRPLQEVFEAIAQRYNLFSVKGELAHLAELHENIAAQSSKGGSDVNRFLQWWDQNCDKLSLSVPGNTNAVSILTIHKSKGLQFPAVIVPYASWEFRSKANQPLLWVGSNHEPFNLLPKYPIQATNIASKSLFAHDVLEEEMKEVVDNINLLYVAFTRPEQELYIYAPLSKKEKNNDFDTINSTSKLIRSIIPRMEILQTADSEADGIETYYIGEKIYEQVVDGKTQKGTSQWTMDNYPVGSDYSGIKLKMESEDFFASAPIDRFAPLEHGKVMHELFSNILTIADIDRAIHKAVVDGIIDHQLAGSLKSKIEQTLNSDPFADWFSGTWQVKTEKSILTPNGHSYRPDRVMFSPTKTIVVDFKFGAEVPAYAKQVQRYVRMIEKMGYNNVSGYIWYVDIGKLTPV